MLEQSDSCLQPGFLTLIPSFDYRNNMAPNQYRHIPLSSSHSIRILKLLPSVDRDSPIIIDLEEVRITMKPKYRALSYAWGEEAPSCPVRCGNKVLLVTPNCLAAMRQLRDRSGFLRFWIDSICIDQSSPSERSAQVALMGEIYRDASMVIVWLGEGDQATEDAIEFLISLTDVGPINMLDAEGVRQAINQKSKPLIEGNPSRQPCLPSWRCRETGQN